MLVRYSCHGEWYLHQLNIIAGRVHHLLLRLRCQRLVILQPPLLVHILPQLLLTHQEHAQQAGTRDAYHDLPDQARCAREHRTNFIFQRPWEARYRRNDRVRDLDTLRELRPERLGEVLQELILQDRASDDDAPALGARMSGHIRMQAENGDGPERSTVGT